MLVHELLTATACAIEPETTLQQAAILMGKRDVGALAVLKGNHVVGIVTDRDLAVRGMAAGLSPEAPVSLVMTRGAHACHADEHVADVLLDMELLQVCRVPIENEDDEFIGMLSLRDLAVVCTDEEVGRAYKHIHHRRHQEVAREVVREVAQVAAVPHQSQQAA